MLIALTVLPPVRLFATIAAFVAIVEMLRPAQTGGRFRGRADNVAVLAINIAAFGLIVERWPELFARVGRWGLMDALVPSRYHNTWIGVVATTLVYAFVWDFFQYWAHRAEHCRLLWPMHSVHHDDQCMNATTSGRRTIASTLFGYVAIHVPTTFVVGPTMLTVVGSTVLFSGWGYLNHANVRLPFGRASMIVTGPQLHRMHHGLDERYHDSNYAAFFPILDRMFGTLLLPEPNEWPRTGVTSDARSLSISLFWPWSLPTRRRAVTTAVPSAAWSGADAPGRRRRAAASHLRERLTPAGSGGRGFPFRLSPSDRDGSVEFVCSEVGPGLFSEENGRSGRLPQHEIGDASLARRSHDDVHGWQFR